MATPHLRHKPAVPGDVLEHPAAWTAAELKGNPSAWVYTFTPEDIQELQAAADAALATGKRIEDVTLEDFHLPQLGPVLTQIQQEVSHGRGCQLLRGLPVERWSKEQTVVVYWGIGLHWGTARSNNKAGHLVGHIKDIGQDPNKPETRLYATNAPQPYHNDGPADLVSLLCLSPSKEGGASHWVSSYSIYNAIVRHRPDLLPVLTGPWYFDRKGEVPPGKEPFFEIPVFNFHAGYLSVNFSSNYYFLSQRHPDVPRLTPAHLEAIKVVEDLAQSEELRMDHVLQPGEIQLLSNHSVLHARGAFMDGAQPSQQRHLLRLWLAPQDERPLPPAYADIMGSSLEVGKRGGIVCEGTQPHVSLDPLTALV